MFPPFNSAGNGVSPNVLVAETSTQTLTNKTLSSPTLSGTVTSSADINITSGTTGTSETTGALTVNGDVGIDGHLRLPDVSIGDTAMNFGGGYSGGGVTIYKTYGIVSVRNSIRFYETNGSGTDGFITLKAPDSWSQSSHGVPEHTLTLPRATDTLVGRATTDTLTNKTLTSPVINDSISGSAILDEDDMSSNSDTKLATQQSIKAYVDNAVSNSGSGSGGQHIQGEQV